MKRICWACLALVLCLTGCAHEVSTQYFMMDTVMSFTIDGEQAKPAEHAVVEEIARLEQIFSPTREDSELTLVNKGKIKTQSATFDEVLQVSRAAKGKTGGAFDPYLGALITLWGKGKVPDAKTIQRAPRNRLNFGGVVKGYASERVREILDTYQIPRAVISLGGNVYVRGTHEDGAPWVVGVRDPDGGSADTIGVIRASDQFLIASGDYERFFEQDGVRYHHILDTKTGAPAQTDLREVVIVNRDGTWGDIYSTALFVMGSEKALDFWRKSNDFEAILVKKDHTVLVTAGLRDAFTLTDSGYTMQVVER